jgi:predicted  nucleic acid-binding Zn-ribbon protein
VHPDLERLIRLQALDSEAAEARKAQSTIPETQRALDQKLDGARGALAAAKDRLAANQTERRVLEKDLASVSARLSRYKDQLMEVKTNKEYHAMQTEIATAETLVRQQEDRLLERMEEAEVHAVELKASEAALKDGQAEVTAVRAKMEAEHSVIGAELARITGERATVAAGVSAAALALFERVSKHRRGQAMSEARDGLCLQCHVRLRPQVFNTVRRGEELVQCESCSRILFAVPAAAPDAATSPS